MDHLPLPQERFLGAIPIPFLAVDNYNSPFHDYPERSGWHLDFNGDATPRLTYASSSRASKNLASLLQTWLYFGMLTEFLGEPIDMEVFKTGGEGGPLLTSDCLEGLVCARTAALLQQSRAYGPGCVESWRDAFNKVLLSARHDVLFLTTTNKEHEISLTCLAISVLAEYLMDASMSLCIKSRVETPVPQVFRIANFDVPCDCGLPILELMKQRGWCPHDIELLNVAQVKTVSKLWYLANLSPPKSAFSHEACTFDQCKPLHIVKEQYRQAHVEDGCDCASIGPEQGQVASIINAGKIPLVSIQDNQVRIHEQKTGSAFVTISHVWADGKGNPRGNTLPLCIAQEIQELVNGLPQPVPVSQVPFWMDTFCIPRAPEELKRKALLRMREPYEYALHVLVIDSYLRCHLVSQSSPSRILALIAVCGWSQRLWTFQEGRIPRKPARTWFAFKDKSIDLLAECSKPFTLMPTLASNLVDRKLLYDHHQTQLMDAGLGFKDFLLQSVESLRTSLRTRATSRREDEALCLGAGILRLPTQDMKEIIDTTDGDIRMAKIWANLPIINVGIAFSRAPTKLRTKGFRWAPATFMGNLNLSHYDWEGPNGCWRAPPASIAPGGLVITLPAWILSLGVASCRGAYMRRLDPVKFSKEMATPVYAGDGRWFNCTLGGAWHDYPAILDPDEHLVILTEGRDDFNNGTDPSYKRVDRFSKLGNQWGLIATYSGTIGAGDTVQTTVHRHVELTRLSKAGDEVRNALKTYADEVAAAHSKTVERLREDDKALRELVVMHVEDRLRRDTETMELMKAINVHDGWGDGDTLAFNDCIFLVKWMVQYGPCYVVQRFESNMTWCVD